MAKNDFVNAVIKDGKLVITMDFDAKGIESASGKSLVHSSSRGNVGTAINGKQVKIGINCYSEK